MAARYHIKKEIGRGAMGRVYLAHDSLLERDVALKELIAPHYLSDEEREEVRERFRLEAKAAARLSHPQILTVHDIIASGDRQFIVMEYLEGKTLRDVIAERALSAEEVMSIAPMISDALGYAHSQGIIHRDVKPDNIFVLENGNIKVADFGIAKMLKVTDRTHTDVIMGTPNYISPELVRGLSYDQRVDMFSLGVTIYELLTCRRPFDADNDYAIIYKVASEEPVPLDEIREDLPPDLVRIVHRTLEKDPARRYGDMKELKEELMQVRADLGMSTAGREERFSKEKALQSALEAAKGMDDLSPEAADSGGLDFRRDKEWVDLISLIYRQEPDKVDPVLTAERKAHWEEAEDRAKAGARRPAAGGFTAGASAPAVAAKQKRLPKVTSPEKTLLWGVVVIGVGLLLVVSVLLPWMGKNLYPNRSLYGITFPEGMVVAAMTALVMSFDILLLLEIGRPQSWTRAMKTLSFLILLVVLLFFGLRVFGGVGYARPEGLVFSDYLHGVGYGLWMALACAVGVYLACRKVEKAAL